MSLLAILRITLFLVEKLRVQKKKKGQKQEKKKKHRELNSQESGSHSIIPQQAYEIMRRGLMFQETNM